MKKVLSYLGVILASLAVSTNVVTASTSSTREININACNGTVYTNYYLLLDANKTSSFTNYSSKQHNTIAEYNNNFFATNFDQNNVGYGQMSLGNYNNGTTQMSIDDFYGIYLKAIGGNGNYTNTGSLNCSNGVCSNYNRTKNYFVIHSWDSVNNGTVTSESKYLDLRYQTVNVLKANTLTAYSSINQIGSVSNYSSNPLKLSIERTYYGSLPYGTSGVRVNDDYYYVHPAVYYIQYCQSNGSYVSSNYSITYNANANNEYVSNMPNNTYVYDGTCSTIAYNIPERYGYTFAGWSTSAYSSAVSYSRGQSYCGREGNLNLYAVWRKNGSVDPYNNNYYVYYNSNINETVANMPSSQSQNVNYDLTLTSTVPQRSGYTFAGWSTSANSNYVSYMPGSIYQGRNTITLYAVWTPNYYYPQSQGSGENNNSNYNTVDNPSTGVESYIMPIGGSILTSLAGLFVFNKKKFLKQL